MTVVPMDPWSIEPHPAADLFPMLDDDELQELADDIAEHGLHHAIVMLDGMVLDGRNRLRACEMVDVRPSFVDYDGDDPIAFVVSVNLHRRHLMAGQRAALAVSIEEMYAVEARAKRDAPPKKGADVGSPEKRGASDPAPEKRGGPEMAPPKKGAGRERRGNESARKAATDLGVNHGYVSDAKAIKNKSPAVFGELQKGRINLPQAKAIAALPEDEREELLEDLPKYPPGGAQEALRRIQRQQKERRALDAYYTPDDVALKCVQAIGLASGPTQPRVLEPSVGGGAFARALRSQWRAIIDGLDIDEKATGLVDCDAHEVIDFDHYSADPGSFDWVVGNPPYIVAESHVRKALSLEPAAGVAFLLRLGFLESEERVPFWKQHPPAEIHVLTKRPSFTGNGSTDATAYALFIWRTGHASPPVLGWIR